MRGLRLGLGLGLSRSAGLSPLALFTANEQGFIYDPSDFTTLYRDNAGTTPVTAVGQTVGLVLDKSKGLVLGNELAVNGNFSDGGTGWILNTGWSVSGGSAVATNASGILDQVSPSIQNGKTYRVQWTIPSYTAGSVQVRIGGGNAGYYSAAGSYSVFVIASSSPRIEFVGNSFTGTIDNISVRELPGNHATQSVLASRPILQQDANGKFYLLFDGSDDFLVTNTITPGTDKAQVFAGVRKLSDAARAALVDFGGGGNGFFNIEAPSNASNPDYIFRNTGTLAVNTNFANYPAPITNIVTGLGDISGDRATLRVNGAQVGQSTGDQGTGNYLAYPAYIGRRGGTLLPFNGRLYGLIARFGANLSDVQIRQTEQWLNQKTGAF